jgi:hypothetical protein
MANTLVPGQNTMLQNVAYALPAYVCRLLTDGAAPTLQQSSTEAFTANVAVTLAGGDAVLSGGFVRSTAGNLTVLLKR